MLGKRGRKSHPRQRQKEGGDLPSPGLWEETRQDLLWLLGIGALLGLQQFKPGENPLNWASCADEADWSPTGTPPQELAGDRVGV